MPLMQRAHRGHKSDTAPRIVCGARSLLHPVNCPNDFHEWVSEGLRSRLPGALTEEINHVRSLCGAAKLPQQSRNLSPMVRAVIHKVLHRFPKRMLKQRSLRIAEFKYA